VDVDLSQWSWPNLDQPSTPLVLSELAGDEDLLREAARPNLFSIRRNAKLLQRIRDAAERAIARAKELEQQVAIATAEATAIKSALKQANTTIARLQNSEKMAVAQRDQWQAKARELESKLAAVTQVSDTAVEADLETAKQTIKRLRSAGRRAVAQRDQWEARAKELEGQLANLRPKNAENDNHKFAQTKRIFAKLYHPNALVGLSPLEKVIRGELFKEFWAELERIEREH
jgi:chromosome segregation ATPase